MLMSAEQFRQVKDPSFIGTIPIDELGGERWELHYSAKLGTHLAYRSVETATKQEAS
ncbi:hypothetical protein B8V81_5076 [Paenibacillus pasadenensis]|uniref:Uncharacterized protein n=1 Tax=Paenibacillus pasadenensis TaxID=217090 RepID=A0A2N5MZM6_9BACL|nr:hypothetical protein B8V81_5076 [Paenibacillus pasadenensis]